jgi:hypothetical protein
MNTYTKLPDMWLKVLRARRGQGETVTEADLIVAWELLSQAKFSYFVKMTNDRAAEWGLSRHAKVRALNRLARWGLIAVKRHHGRRWKIRVRYLAGRQPRGDLQRGRMLSKVTTGTSLPDTP